MKGDGFNGDDILDSVVASCTHVVSESVPIFAPVFTAASDNLKNSIT